MGAVETIGRLEQQGVIPVLRMDDGLLAREAVSALQRAGFGVFEITLTIPGASEIIAELTPRPALLAGAGTVLSLDDARQCIEAGASFLVAPCLLEGLADLCREADVACIMGALTPSEVRQAVLDGADAVKIFPIASMGGATYVKALRSVFPGLTLIPTGGIRLDNLDEYLAAGAICVGVGGDLFDPRDLAAGRGERIAAQGRAYLERVQQHRLRETARPSIQSRSRE